MGFCLFNNVAIAAEFALRELGAERVFILDWDVHHGNGTAEAFRRRADVLFASIHQSGIYPGTGALGDMGSGPGEGYTINLPVPSGSEEDLWLSLIEHIALPGRAGVLTGPRAASPPALTLIAKTRWRAVCWRRPPSRRWPAMSASWPSSCEAARGGHGGRLSPGRAGTMRACTLAALSGDEPARSCGARGAFDLARRRSRRSLLAPVARWRDESRCRRLARARAGFDAQLRFRDGVDAVEFPTASWRLARERFGAG